MTILRSCMVGLSVLALLAGCSKQSQNQYDYSEVGKSSVAEFGTVIGVREVEVKAENTGTGALAGGVAGGVAGNNMGNGYGQVVGLVGGALVGAAAGSLAEQSLSDYKAMEYTVIKENGKTLTLVQNTKPDEPVFKQGDRVLVQTSGSYQRVLPTTQIPTEIARPKGVKFRD